MAGVTSGHVIEQEAFQDVIGRFASGVAVVTTRAHGRDFGTTASAVSSLSLEPPMVLVCLDKTSETGGAIREAGCFAVNILAHGQIDVAHRFAVESPTKLRSEDVLRASSGLPLIAGALAQIECWVANAVTGGTHTVFLAEVAKAEATEGDPLTYYRGRFGRFEDKLQEAAYRQIRGMVLNRELPLGAPLDPVNLAGQLGLEESRVFYALTKLMTDGLLTRDGGEYVIVPLDSRTAVQALDARYMIEISVAEAVGGRLSPADQEDLRALALTAVKSARREPPDVAALARASRAFHERFVALADNDLTSDFYRRLRIDRIWWRALRHGDGPHFIDPGYLLKLVDACAAGDGEGARRVLREHVDHVRQTALEAIERSGGVV